MGLKIKVVSSIPPDPKWGALAAYTCETQRRFCERHGYSYHLDVSDIWETVRSPIRGDSNCGHLASIRHFVKFRLFQHFLTPERCRETYDWVVWIDADCLITNYAVPLEKFMNGYGADAGPGPLLGDVIIPHDVNGLHPTVIMMRSSVLTRGLSWACANMGQTMFQQHDWDDIMAFRFYFATEPYRPLLWDQHSAQVLCAMHPGLYPIPPDVRAQYEWNHESLSLHLSALDMDKRLLLAKEYAERLSLLS